MGELRYYGDERAVVTGLDPAVGWVAVIDPGIAWEPGPVAAARGPATER